MNGNCLTVQFLIVVVVIIVVVILLGRRGSGGCGGRGSSRRGRSGRGSCSSRTSRRGRTRSRSNTSVGIGFQKAVDRLLGKDAVVVAGVRRVHDKVGATIIVISA